MTKELTIDREKGFDSIDFEVSKNGSINIFERQEGEYRGVTISSRKEWRDFKNFVDKSFQELDSQFYEKSTAFKNKN